MKEKRYVTPEMEICIFERDIYTTSTTLASNPVSTENDIENSTNIGNISGW